MIGEFDAMSDVLSQVPLSKRGVALVRVKSLEAPGVIGEPGTSYVMPALTNAIFAATGKRIRKLPVRDQARAQST
jgi:isoquinoline 1-oxidoreductase beta subunit